MYRPVLIGLAAVTLAACKPAAPPESAPAAAPSTAMGEAAADAEMKEQTRLAQVEQRARAAADPVVGVIERAELCLHFGGEEPFDAARGAQIDKAFEDNRCDTVVADGDALKASHPQDAARIDAALADLRG
ncbi:hypothetical protein BH10PSE1_BH10PSE1_27560 [soil metagenome]